MMYLLHAGLLLSACFLYYWLLLRNETHFTLNRWVLLGCLAGSVALPLVTVPAAWSLRTAMGAEAPAPGAPTVEIAEVPLGEKIPVPDFTEELSVAPPEKSAPGTGFTGRTPEAPIAGPATPVKARRTTDYRKLAWWVYLGGVLVFGLHFLVQFAYLVMKVIRHPGYDAGGFHLVEMEEDAAPFSFWNRVFLNPDRYDLETFHQIVRHEAVHVRQRHSLDLLLAELVVIVQWCNPFAWLYRRAIENNLEFLTDAEVLRQGEDPVGYQMSLVRVAVPNFPLGLTTSYNQSLLEKRIAMMKAKKSSLASGWKYLTIFPLLLLSMLQFNAVAQVAPEAPANPPAAVPPGSPAAPPASAAPSAPFSPTAPAPAPASPPAAASPGEIGEAVAPVPPPPSPSVTTAPVPHTGNGALAQAYPVPSLPKAKYPMSIGLPNLRDMVSISDETFAKARRSWTADIEGSEVCFTFIVTQDEREHLSTNSRCFSRTALGTLPTGQAGDFALTQESGTISFNGVFTGKEGLGSFNFVPDADFKQMLADRGYGDYEDTELLHFFFIDFTEGYLDYLAREGYKPSARELFKLAIFGLSEKEFRSALSAYQDAGYRKPAMDEMIKLRIHGVSKEYISEVSGLGFGGLSLDEITKAKIHGLSAEFVRDMSRAGFRNLSFDEVINMSIHGISSEYVAELQALGYGDLSADEVVSARIHGVRTERIENLRKMGLDNLSLEEARSASVHGVDEDYVRELTELGYTNLTVDDVISAKIHGVSKRKIGDLKKAGLTGLSLKQAKDAAIHGVNARQVQELRDMGYTMLTFDDFVSARIHGITPRFVKSYEGLGYGTIPFGKLINLKIHGVSADYIRKFRDEGDSVDDLINDKIHGRHR